jgi:hypothetical protein
MTLNVNGAQLHSVYSYSLTGFLHQTSVSVFSKSFRCSLASQRIESQVGWPLWVEANKSIDSYVMHPTNLVVSS